MGVGHRDIPGKALLRSLDCITTEIVDWNSFNAPEGSHIKHLTLGPVRVAARGPSILWSASPDVVQIATHPLGFDGAPEEDLTRWLNAFRRLLDGLDAPLQVLIEIEPGSGDEGTTSPPTPRDFDEMRSADVWFVDHLAQAPSAHRRLTSLVISKSHASRLEVALSEM